MVKYRTEIYEKRSIYSTPGIPISQVLSKSCFNNIPNTLDIDNQKIEIFNADGHFLPRLAVNWERDPTKQWTHDKKSDSYTHLDSGLKVILKIVRDDNWDEWRCNGTCTTTLTVKIPTPSQRGKNPNSHNNRKIPGLVSKDINLTEEQWQTVETLGEGRGYSQGVRNLLNQVS